MTSEQAEENGYSDGESDGFAGNAERPVNGDRLPPELRVYYRTGYREGYKDGLAAYRRTVE